MDWSKGLSASYNAYIVDPITWRDTDEIQIINGTISKSEDDLRESADISVLNYESDTEQWIRIYLNARQLHDSARCPIFTGLISSPTKDIDGNIQTNNLNCYSVLKPASDILLPKGYYVPYGTDVAYILRSLLSIIRGTPIDTEGVSRTLSQTIIAESNETHLSMANKILYFMGLRMYISGDGSIVVSETDLNPVTYFDANEFDSLETKLNIENNWFYCPNVFRAIEGDFSAIAIDDDPDSPLSTVNRGREIWMEETNCNFDIGESLAQYAERRLKEEQQVLITASYTRRFDPDVNVSDVITLMYPGQGLAGNYYVTSQNISLGYSPSVSEVVYKL